jgi:MFS family permease
MVITVISSSLIYFLRSRIPPTEVLQPARYGLSFLWTRTFSLLQMGLIMESLGYSIPGIYIPAFARSLGLSSSIGTLLVVALVNAASVPSIIILAMLIDRFHVTTVIIISTVGAVLSAGDSQTLFPY